MTFPQFWQAEIRRNPAVLGPIIAFIATCAMNAHGGYHLTNRSWLFALILVGFAVLTAKVGWEGLSMRGWSGRRFGLVLWLIVGLVIDQQCAWQSLGVMFADGQTARASKGQSLGAVSAQIRKLQAERDRIGQTRPVATIEAAAALECKKTSRAYPDGVGPECTKLRQELGQANRVLAIDADLPALVKKLDTQEQVAEGDAQFAAHKRVAKATLGADWSSDDVSFWILLFLSAALGIGANLGFWLVGVEHESNRHGGAPGAGTPPGGQHPDDAAYWGAPRLPQYRSEPLLPRDVPVSSSQGAPITINFAGAPPVGAGQSAQTVDSAPAPAASQAKAPPAAAAPPLPTPEAPPEPVARRPINESVDRIATFQAACLKQAAADALISVDLVYARYLKWAQGRAVSAPAFQALLEASGATLAMIGGQAHLVGLSLREDRARLQAVG